MKLLSEWANECIDDENVKFVAKEMPIEKYKENNRNSNVDYVVIGKYVYLVELKTTQDSFDSDQFNTYINFMRNSSDDYGKNNGTGLISMLHRIVYSQTEKVSEPYKQLKDFFEFKIKDTDGENLIERAHIYQKKNNIISTGKYLHTIASVIKNTESEDWEKPLKLVYITPKPKTLPNDIANIALRDVCNENDNKYKEFYADNELLYSILKKLFL